MAISQQNTSVIQAVLSAVIVLTLLFYPTTLYIPTNEFLTEISDQIKEFNECTTGVASGFATPDSRPLLWKNRDCGEEEQEYHYVDNGAIAFIGLTYANTVNRYFAGMNAAGFAVENSTVYNLDFADGYNAGYIMKLALETCRSVDDFEAILDSTDSLGRSDCSDFGVIDAFGGAAVFEAGRQSFTRFDAVDTDEGFLIRSNFAYSGSDTSGNNETYGLHRHDRARQLWKSAVDDGNLTPLYIYQNVVRDLTSRDCDPYPLPFDGYYDTGWQTWTWGHVPQTSAINRSSTQSVFVAQGVNEDDNPNNAVIWAMGGSPLGCIFTPLWVRAGSIPPQYDSNDLPDLCRIGINIKDFITEEGDGVDSRRLSNPDQTGFYDFALPLEAYIYSKTIQYLNSRNFNHDQLQSLQNELAEQAVDSLEAWRPAYNVSEKFEIARDGDDIVLSWNEISNQFGNSDHIEYRIFRSDFPFREGNDGELLGSVEVNNFIDEVSDEYCGFYRVVAMIE
jgi:hypothetical protein